MNYFTRQRLVFWAFVLLVVMNISAIATVIYQRNRNTHSPFTGETMRHYVNGELELRKNIDFSPQGPGNSSIGVRINRVDWFRGAIHKAKERNQFEDCITGCRYS